MRLIDLVLEIFKWLMISVIICTIGGLISWAIQGKEMAFQMVWSYAYHFNGIFIIGTGYGTLFFILKTYPNAFQNLLSILDLSEELKLELTKGFDKVKSPLKHNLISIIITLIGGGILLQCGYPLEGFSKFFLAITSISLFYVGGLMFSYLIFTIMIFRTLDEHNHKITFQKNTEIVELENLNVYLTTIFLSSVIALYLAFRGTLTANFTFENTVFNETTRQFLLFPIVVFLPFVLFSGFYIRYVLRKIHLNGLTDKIDNLHNLIATSRENEFYDLRQSLELEKMVLEIKEKIYSKSNTISLLSLKDSPSIIIALVLIIQFLYQNDNTIQNFIKSFLK